MSKSSIVDEIMENASEESTTISSESAIKAAIRFRGLDADINFNVNDYQEDLNQINNLTKEEFVHILRRQSTGFSRRSSNTGELLCTNAFDGKLEWGNFLERSSSILDCLTVKLKLQGSYTILMFFSLSQLSFNFRSVLSFTLLRDCTQLIWAYDKAAIKCNGREAVINFEPAMEEKQSSTLSPTHMKGS